MSFRSLYFILISFCALPYHAYGSSCGEAAIPFSFEALEDGHPVLGCARPSCFGWTLEGEIAGAPSSFYRINKRPDGFVRAMFNYSAQGKVPEDFEPPLAKCSRRYEITSCERYKEGWVGGVAPLLNVTHHPLSLQCCTYENLKKTQDRGVAIVSPGQLTLGGEVFEDGRLYAFDYIRNIEKKTNEETGSVYYEVSMRRMSCLPYPQEFAVKIEDRLIEHLVERAMSIDLHTTESTPEPTTSTLPTLPPKPKSFKMSKSQLYGPKIHVGSIYRVRSNSRHRQALPAFQLIQGPFAGEPDTTPVPRLPYQPSNFNSGNLPPPPMVKPISRKPFYIPPENPNKVIYEHTPVKKLTLDEIFDSNNIEIRRKQETPIQEKLKNSNLDQVFIPKHEESATKHENSSPEIVHEPKSYQSAEKIRDEISEKGQIEAQVESQERKLEGNIFQENLKLQEEIAIMAQIEALKEELLRLRQSNTLKLEEHLENPLKLRPNSKDDAKKTHPKSSHARKLKLNSRKPHKSHVYKVSSDTECNCCGSDDCRCCMATRQRLRI